MAQYAESAGIDSLWAGEHIVLPNPQPPGYGIAPEIPFLDAIVALTLAAANTTSITVATGIIELPLHQPVLLAKQLASVDQISHGRLMVGVGVGYLPLDSTLPGVPLDERAGRTDEYIAAMRALWTMEAPEFHGSHVDFAGVDANPLSGSGRWAADPDRWQQRGSPGVGRSPAPAAGSRPTSISTPPARRAAALDRDLNELERPDRLGPFDFTVISPRNRLDRELVDGYRELGVDRLIVLPGLDVPTERRYHGIPIDDVFRTVDHLAEFAQD